MGKTALLAQFLADPGGDVPPVVLRASGEETEDLLAYGVLDQLARSAGPARRRRRRGRPPRTRSPSVRGCWTCSARSRLPPPSWWCVDDAHWVDQPSLRALVFALRRLVADPVVALLAVRDTEEPDLPESLRRIVGRPDGQRAAVAWARRGGSPRPRRGTRCGAATGQRRQTAPRRDAGQSALRPGGARGVPPGRMGARGRPAAVAALLPQGRPAPLRRMRRRHPASRRRRGGARAPQSAPAPGGPGGGERRDRCRRRGGGP